MAKVLLKRLYDEYDCDTCGPSYADGFEVYIDDKLEATFAPHAGCFGGDYYTREDMLEWVLIQLGHTVTDDNQS